MTSLPRRSRRRSTLALALIAGLIGPATAGPVHAYEPSRTHAGLAEKSAYRSGLHRFLREVHRLPLGLFNRVTLTRSVMGAGEATQLIRRLRQLDPATGAVPDELRRVGAPTVSLPAIGWLVAGAMLEQQPAHRERHHFYDPVRKGGLRVPGVIRQMAYRVLDAFESGGTLGGIVTGSNFDLSGDRVDAWLVSRDNEHGVHALSSSLARAALASDESTRQTHLALGLIGLGATLHLLADAAVPGHVRNDFGAQLGRGPRSTSTFDRASAYEAFVDEQFGRWGIPEPQAGGEPGTRARLRDYLVLERAPGDTGAAAPGLVDYTWPRYFSAGTVPRAVSLIPGEAPPLKIVNRTLPISRPSVDELDLVAAAGPEGGYVKVEGRRVLRYRQQGDSLVFDVDERCHLDAARDLLPRVIAAGTAYLDQVLTRALVTVGAPGQLAEVRWNGAPLRNVELVWLAGAPGSAQRRVVARQRFSTVQSTARVSARDQAARQAAGSAEAVVLQGENASGEPVVAFLARP
jgi:hypothetical protein